MTRVEVIVNDRWTVGVSPGLYAGCRTGADPWIGELSVQPKFKAKDFAGCDDWLDVARLSAARFFASYGFAVGEAPRPDGEPEWCPDGTVRIRFTALVTVPPYWTGPPEIPGQAGLWDGGDAA